MRRRHRELVVALVAAAGAGCAAGPHRTRPLSRLDAAYLSGELTRRAPPTAATRLYRGGLARSLGARCRMFPTDSQLFDRRAADCGAATAAVLGVARLFLESAASAQLMTALVADGRLRWVDLPRTNDCWP